MLCRKRPEATTTRAIQRELLQTPAAGGLLAPVRHICASDKQPNMHDAESKLNVLPGRLLSRPQDIKKNRSPPSRSQGPPCPTSIRLHVRQIRKRLLPTFSCFTRLRGLQFGLYLPYNLREIFGSPSRCFNGLLIEPLGIFCTRSKRWTGSVAQRAARAVFKEWRHLIEALPSPACT